MDGEGKIIDITKAQALPVRGSGSVVDDLVALLHARRDFGRRKYGTELQPFNGRDAHLDALQELVDLFQYLHQVEMERAALADALKAAEELVERVTAERDAARSNLQQLSRDLEAETRARQQLEAGRG